MASEQQTKVLVFGDLTNEFDANLRSLTAKKDNALLKAFLDRVVFALRAEIGLLATLERESFVRFSTFEEILNKVAEAGSCHPALRKALTCTSQFGSFISHFTETGKTYPTAADTRIVGLCTGLLTGSAISCCQSMSDLVLVAVHTVIIAFRTGLCASEVGSRVEPSADASASWSYMIPGLSGDVANKALESFSNDKGLPVASRPYISAYADNGVTLSGPPSVLEELLRSKRLPRSGSLKIKIPSPYHAAHLYKLSDVDNILKSITEGPFARYERKISVASSINGKSIQAGTYAALMRSAVTEILLEPLYINKISERLASELKKASRTNFTIMPVGTLAAQTFVSAFRKAGLPDVGVDNSMNKSVTAKSEDTSNSGNFASSKLAIIAYSGRYPDAANNEEFWSILHEGRDVHSVTPATRWDVNTHVDPSGKKKNTSGTPYGCWLKDPGFFDARFFSMSPREAPQVDPAQRLLLMTTYEAIENAGIVPDATPSTARDRVGVFCGTTSNDWGETNSSQNIDTYYIPGSCRAFIPGRSNYYFKFSGPSYSVDTACSSSLSAMHVACNALWQGDVDTAISSGTNVMTNPDITAGLDRGHFLSRTGNCKTFDDGADGYCRGEGVCTVIIKRLEDAVADNDPILGLILGSYVNHSAEAESITRPHVGAQKDIFKKVLTKASVDPSTIGYVEMHGTGTQAGDAREMESVLSTFASETALTPRSADQKLYIGSAKSNVGHGESVSGIIALIKVLMMMEKNEIPRHVGIKTKINTIFPKNLAERNIHIAMENTPWLRPEGGQRRAFINNFSAAGGNSSLLVGDAPIRKRIESADPRTTHMVAVTAKSTNAIVANMKSMIRYIEENNPSLASLSYTTTARRAHHPYRVMVNGSDLSEITAQLKKAIIASEGKSWPRGTPTVAFAFTGQGSQYVGMARELLQFSRFRKDFERFDAIAQQQGFPALMPLLSQTEGDILDFEPLVVQLASTCMQMAMARLWQSWSIEPIAVVGHSLGEYAALNVAGVLSDSDTIFLTGKRAQLLQEKCTRDTHAMLAVRASVNDIHKFLDGMTFEIACKNGPTETVLSGTNTEIDRVYDALSAGGFKQTRLRVPYAFHSSQVQTILEDFEHAARSVIFHAPKVPVISPLLGEVITEAGTFSASYLSRHCREAVNFAGAIAAANTSILKPTTVWVELGPHPVVGGLVKTNLGNVTVLPTCQRSKDTWKVITSSINTLYTLRKDIKFIEYHHDFKNSVEALKLPAYNWDLENYWMQYVNDWSLYKGDAKFLAAAPLLSTTSVQRIVEEKHEDNKITLVSESDLAREDLDPMCRGHRVNGVALCTPSVYADIALTLGEYIRKQRPEWKDCLVDVQKMDVQKPLVAKPKGSGPQLLRCRVLMFCATPKAAVEFYTVNAEGKKLIRHAECYITYPNAKQARDKYQNNAVATLGRMDEIRANLVHDDRVQKLNRSTSYKMVESLASYDEEFKGVEECVLDSANLEAVSRVRFLPHPTKGDFFVNPHLIDNFGQPALFTMNANDTADLEKEVFVNHGWTSLQFYKPVSMDKTYHSYVKMSGPKEDGMYDGDMVIYEGSEVVAAYIGVKAQGVPRRLMDYIVKMKDDSKPATKAAPPVPAVAVIDTSAPVATAIKTTTTTVESTVTPIVQTDSWNDALNIISEESGVPVSELTGDTAFADLGVDSLLSLLCASRFREELGLDYESHIFVDNSTVKELETFWKSNGGTGASTGNAKDAVLNSMFRDDNVDEVAPNVRGLEVMQSSKAASSIGTESPSWNDDSSIDGRSDVSSLDNSFEVVSTPTSSPPTAKLASTSLFLQGSVSAPSTKKTLFMLPDGSGSASSYAAIPRLDPSIAVVGLNCPFMKIPEHYNVGIDKVAALYISEIRRRQPNGPYAFGGWSVGGIFAYHVAQQLVAEGETVTDLILIDCPVPEGLDHLPKRYYEYCDSIGLLGEVNGVKKAPPPWLIKHFEMCVDSLHSYYATPFPAAAAPRTHIIWACDSIDKHIEQKFERRPDDTPGLNFLVESRTDFGPCGWETLLPRNTITISASTGANHFSMMKGDHGKKLGKMIAGALLRK